MGHVPGEKIDALITAEFLDIDDAVRATFNDCDRGECYIGGKYNGRDKSTEDDAKAFLADYNAGDEGARNAVAIWLSEKLLK